MASWLDCCIDVSHNNGTVDWANLDPLIALAFIKATQGSGFVDPKFAENKAGALARGLMIVPYHFLDGSEPDGQVANFGQYLEPGMPYALDWEGRASQTAAAGNAEAIGTALAANIGRPPVGYWGIPGSSPADPTPGMGNWTRWIPRYPVQGARDFSNIPADKFGLILAPFWQYTAWGRVTGISGDVDRSVWNGTLDELRAWYGAAAVAPPAPAPAPTTLVPPTPDTIQRVLAAPDFREAIRAFQAVNSLEVDGQIGPNTLRKIGEDMRTELKGI